MALDSRRNMSTPTRRGGTVPSPSTKTQKRPFPSPNMGHEAAIRRMEPSHNTPPRGRVGLSSAPLPDKPAGALMPNPTSDRGYAPPGTQMPKSSSLGKVNKGTTPKVNRSSLERAARRKLGM